MSKYFLAALVTLYATESLHAQEKIKITTISSDNVTKKFTVNVQMQGKASTEYTWRLAATDGTNIFPIEKGTKVETNAKGNVAVMVADFNYGFLEAGKTYTFLAELWPKGEAEFKGKALARDEQLHKMGDGTSSFEPLFDDPCECPPGCLPLCPHDPHLTSILPDAIDWSVRACGHLMHLIRAPA